MNSAGQSVRVAKPVSLLLDDIAGHVARTGRLPTDPVYRPFLHMFENTIKVGDELIDVGGAGDALRERLLLAAQKSGGLAPVTFRQQRQRILSILKKDLMDSATLNALGQPHLSDRVGIARDFFRRYAAKSDYQLTMPFSGWMANRLRTMTGGATFDIPIGRTGAAGRVQQRLGVDEAEFAANAAQRLSDDVERLNTQRQAHFGDIFLKASARALPSIPNELRPLIQEVDGELRIPIATLSRAQREQLVEAGFAHTTTAYDPAKLDSINRELARLDLSNREARIQRARNDVFTASILRETSEAEADAARAAAAQSGALADTRLESAAKLLEDRINLADDAQAELNRLSDPDTLDLFAAADDINRSFASKDAAVAMMSPAAVTRGIFKRFGLGKTLDNLEDAKSGLMNEQALNDRALRVANRQAAIKLRRFDPEGIGGAGTVDNLKSKALELADYKRSLLDDKAAILAGAVESVTVGRPAFGSTLRQALNRPVQHAYGFAKRKSLFAQADATVQAGRKANVVDVTFADEIDKAIWLSGQSATDAVGKAIAREASEYAQRAMGVRRGRVRAMARQMREDVKEFIMRGKPGKTAGTSAGAQVAGRAFHFTSRQRDITAQLRARDRSGKLKLRSGGGLFKDMPRDVRVAMRRLDRRLEVADQQLEALAAQIKTADDVMSDVNTADLALKENGYAAKRAIEALTAQIAQIREGTFYGVLTGLVKTENAVRKMFQKLHYRPFDQYRREVEEKARFVHDQVLNGYQADVRKALDEIPGSDAMKINNAIQIVMADLVTKAHPNVRGFAVIDGRPMDDLLSVREELSATAEGQALLNHPMVHDIAQRMTTQMSDYLKIEQSLGILPDIDPTVVYFHGTMTEKAEVAMRELLERSAQTAAGTGRQLTDRLPFTQRKTTNRMFWKDDAGNVREIYVGELLDAEKQITREFEAWRQREVMTKGLPDDWMPDVYATSAYHINKHQSEIMPRLSLDVVGPIMEEDIVLRTARRTLQHEHAKAFDTFRRSVLESAVPLSPDIVKSLPKGLGSGTFKYQGLEYKLFPIDVIGKDLKGPLRLPFEDRDLLNYYPAPLVDAVTDYARRMKPSSIDAVLKPLDRIQSVWKQMTLFHPSWSITNMVGGAFNSLFAAGTRPQHWLRHAAKFGSLVWRIHRGDIMSTTRMVEFGGRLMSERELAELLVREGAVNGGRAVQEMLSVVRVGAEEGRSLMARLAAGGPLKRLVGTWFRANAATDDLWRVITLADRLDQGDNIIDAAAAMAKAHFDYGDVTRFEQLVGTRVFPFYRWMRGNIALQLQLFMQKPAIAASFPKLKAAIEQAFDAEQSVPEELRPRWMKDNVAVQLTARPDAKFALLSLFTPIQDLLEVGQSTMGGDGFADMLKYFVSSTSPLIKAPAELAVGREVFTDREIGDPALGKISRMQYLAQQLRPFREASRIYEAAGSPEQTAAGLALDTVRRLSVGGRVQATSDAKLESRLMFESGETASQLRRSIKRAAAEGDTATAQALSVRLVEVYRNLWDLGIYDSVPKSLRTQFAQEWQGQPGATN